MTRGGANCCGSRVPGGEQAADQRAWVRHGGVWRARGTRRGNVEESARVARRGRWKSGGGSESPVLARTKMK